MYPEVRQPELEKLVVRNERIYSNFGELETRNLPFLANARRAETHTAFNLLFTIWFTYVQYVMSVKHGKWWHLLDTNKSKHSAV